MKKNFKSIIAILLALVICLSISVTAFASSDSVFQDDAYATIVTASDFQAYGTEAYDRYGRVLNVMKNDGLPTPDSMLVGGDYTKLLFDYANPGITLIKKEFTAAYPSADENSVICIQGNHDNVASGFTKTGYYDMGSYNLYCINEDDFPWNQLLRPASSVTNTAKKLESTLNTLIENGDRRPVIIITHVPLHHSTRTYGGDNKYASYLFDVINEAAKTLDVVFLYGHNHSDTYDDYIGGSVNFMNVGDTIRIPDADNMSKTTYKEETLNFTYTNCGYIGYSNNTDSDTSTSVLTVGSIQFTNDKFYFTKYSENGLVASYEVDRINSADGNTSTSVVSNLQNVSLWSFAKQFFTKFFELFYKIKAMF